MPEYQSLYRKYRSQTFADLVGQEAASRALQGAIISSRVAHAYLFSGSRGTGKTSAARLLAKALDCSGRARDSAEPCNQCQSCLEMTAGAALDPIAIDAASNRGIDEIRDLREKVNLSPARGPFKIYIIDEAHMLTEPAFNALLKTLEEPPPHVVFILCTTDAQKIPLTVIGRCQQFVFRRHSEEQIVGRLTHIAMTEKVEVDDDAMQLIARTAQGSMRDAVGLLDQLVPLATGWSPRSPGTTRQRRAGCRACWMRCFTSMARYGGMPSRDSWSRPRWRGSRSSSAPRRLRRRCPRRLCRPPRGLPRHRRPGWRRRSRLPSPVRRKRSPRRRLTALSSGVGPTCSNSSTARCALSISTPSPRSTVRPSCCGSNMASITRRRRSSPRSSCPWCGHGWGLV